jgi:ABC-type lipoprotein export system ATPase subunit
MKQYNWDSLLPIENKVCWVIGHSGSGKSSFLNALIQKIKISKYFYSFYKEGKYLSLLLLTKEYRYLFN